MNKALTLTIIFIVIIGTLGFLYSKYELPSKRNQEVKYSNITVSAELNNKKVITGYIIETSQGIITGNTTQSYQLEQVPINETITIYNNNLENQKFYIDKKTINITQNTQRIDLKLINSEDIKIEKISIKPIVLALSSNYAKDIIYCIDYSTSYIFVKSSDNEIEIDEYKDWDKCYELENDLINSEERIRINYTEFSKPKETDNIKILIAPKDLIGINEKIVNIK